MLDASTPARLRHAQIRWALVIGAGALALAVSASALWLSSRGAAGADQPRPLSAAEFFEATGVSVLRVAIVGGGGIVDVRYQAHAGEGHAGDAAIAVLDEETGVLLSDGVHGRHSASTTRPDAVRYVLLANTGGVLSPGETASIVVGDVRLEHVPVE